MSKKIIAILLALSFVFAFAACSAKEEPETTAPVAEGTEAPVEEVTEAPVENVTDAPVEGTEAPVEGETAVSEEATTEAANAKPEGKEAIVEYFNTAINGVKGGAKSVKHHYSKISINGQTKFPGLIDTAMKLLGGADNFINDQLAKNSKGEQNYTGSEAIKKSFPVEGESYASKLAAADVKSAKVSEKDGKYVVEIVLLDDAKSSTVKHGQGHAPKAFNVVLPNVVNDNVPGPVAGMLGGEAEMNYPACKVIATIDVATGNVVTAEYFVNWTINFGDNIVIPFTTHDLYTINY